MMLILALLLLQTPDIDRLAQELTSDSADVRDKAARDLVAIGKPAIEPLKKLAESGKDADLRARAAQIVKDIELALRPRILARVLFAKKEKDPARTWKDDEWIRKAAAEQGYETLFAACALGWTDLSQKGQRLYPEAPDKKPGGVYISARLVEHGRDKGVVEVTCSVQSWKSGRFTVDTQNPRMLVRLADQSPLEDLLLVLELQPK